MLARVPLDRIKDNSFQTRGEYGDIEELAASILKMKAARPETLGLIQVPPGRIVVDGRVLDAGAYGGVLPCLGDEPEAVVELAAGHRRFRAFWWLSTTRWDEYGTFPVDVQVLDDQAMADIAWEENVKRKDLSAIEEAEALRRAMERFGWTQAEIGERWGLSQGAVANKLRLLRLPEEAQQAIRDGVIGERHGRALLAAAGKSARIYERVAEDVLPAVAQPPGAVEKARELLEARNFYRTVCDIEAVCEVCGSSAVFGGDQVYTAVIDNRRVFLCLACFRAGKDWSPPSAAEADDLVQSAIRQERRDLGRATWPLDMGLVSAEDCLPACEDCPAREVEGGKAWCLDGACFKVKKKFWDEYQVAQLQERLERDFGATVLILPGYGGNVLLTCDDVDVALVETGTCAPGRCERIRFHHYDYKSPSYIYPYADLPFVYVCNNSSSHKACQRRYLREQRSEDEKGAERRAKREAEKRRREAKVFLERAEGSVAEALLQGHQRAWHAVALRLGAEINVERSTQESARYVAAQLVRGDMRLRTLDWNADYAVDNFVKTIGDSLKNLDVAMLPCTADLVRKLERISAFVLDEEGQPRGELTLEQGLGNLANLNRILAQATEMEADGWISEQDFERVSGWVRELREALGLSISREIERGGRPTHKALAERLGVAISAVAIVREVLAGSSADSRMAVRSTASTPEAARWLAERRRWGGVVKVITSELVGEIRKADAEDCDPPRAKSN